MAPSTTAVAYERDLVDPHFDDPKFSDLTIKLSDRIVHVHRVVLCRGSEYFTSLLAGRFHVSCCCPLHTVESETGTNRQNRKATLSKSSSKKMTQKL